MAPGSQIWLALVATLAALEIVLGVDNIIFIAILAGRLPPEQPRYNPAIPALEKEPRPCLDPKSKISG